MKEQAPNIDWRAKFGKDQIVTIPNLLSFFRLALIPLIVCLYLTDHPIWALVFICVSALTDMVDGFIARKFNMITDFGKFIDPVADKLTQGIVMICLLTRFLWMWLPIAIMFIKEASAFTLRLIVFRKTEKVDSAKWHGKLTTVVLYMIMALHIIWTEIPIPVSTICIFIASALMLLSCILYTIPNVMILISKNKE